MDIQKIRILLGLSADRPLSPEEKRRRTRYIVYPAMCLLFAGSLWLIYSPSEKERAAEEKEKGFNTDIPSPGQQRMDGNKVDAYEREELEKKDKYRKNAFQEMASLFGSSGKDTVHLPEGMAELPVEEADNPSTGSHNTVRSSAGAYRNMNRTLDNFYTRAENSADGCQTGKTGPASGGVFPVTTREQRGIRKRICGGKECRVQYSRGESADFRQEYHSCLRTRYTDRFGRSGAAYPPAGTDGGR